MFDNVSDRLTARLLGHGQILELKSGVPVPVQGGDTTWLILEGKLDLFLAQKCEGEGLGARHHLMRVEPGDPVFGFEVPDDCPLRVIANHPAGCRILCLDQDQLRNADADGVDHAGPLIERWVEKLGSAISGKTGPRIFLELVPGETTASGDAPAVLLSMLGIIWIRSIEGDLRLLGDHRLAPLERAGFFPVSRRIWLSCSAHARLECFDTDRWREADPRWSGLARFQQQVLAYLVEEHQQREQRERARLATMAEADAAVLEGSLRRLASPEETQEPPEGEGGELALLVDSCRVVAQASGFALSSVVGRLELPKGIDPVRGLADAFRIRSRKVILRGRWWTEDGGAMVAFRPDNKGPVALLPGARGYQQYDPATRRRIAVSEKAAGALNPFAYVLYRPFPPKALSFHDLLTFGLRGCRADMATIVVMGLAAALMGALTPVLTGIIFDVVIPNAEKGTLAQLSAFLGISAVATVLFTITRGAAAVRLQSRMEMAIQTAVWDRLLALPVPFFRQYTSGDLARRSLGISQIRETLAGSALSAILTGIFSTVSCALMFYFSWRLALIATALVFSSFLVVTLSSWLEVGILRTTSELGGALAGMAVQFINGISRFRVTGTETRAFAVWAREAARHRLLAIQAQRISNRVSAFQSAFPVLAAAVVLGCAAWFMKSRVGYGLTTGEFLGFMAAFVQFSTGSLELSAALIAVLNVIPLYERAQPILRCLPEVEQRQADYRELMGNIHIQNVRFRYREDGPWVLRDFSLNISAGEFVAFVGRSGSGKSTLFRLLLGFETPASGAVYYDGQDLAKLDVQAVRRQIGTVLQSARLTVGSVFQNIVGEAPFTLNDAWEAARMAGLEEDLRAMPMGMYTMISEGGGGLSGGQRQRLLIARAIVNRPRVFYFDEATSALDNRTQAIVSRSLRTLNATRIVIAHRLSTVVDADRICVLDKGSVVQSGTYDELMRQEGLFAELAKRQMA
jgi:NHLM bacteriocin system ABC transporter ATP-binding protein